MRAATSATLLRCCRTTAPGRFFWNPKSRTAVGRPSPRIPWRTSADVRLGLTPLLRRVRRRSPPRDALQSVFHHGVVQLFIEPAMPHEQPVENRPVNHVEHDLDVDPGAKIVLCDPAADDAAALFAAREDEMVSE